MKIKFWGWVVGKKGKIGSKKVDSLFLNDEPLEFVPQWCYLGTTIVAGNLLSFSRQPDLSKFYRALNSLSSAVQKPNKLVMDGQTHLHVEFFTV